MGGVVCFALPNMAMCGVGSWCGTGILRSLWLPLNDVVCGAWDVSLSLNMTARSVVTTGVIMCVIIVRACR